MNVTLNPEVQKYIDEQIRAGHFETPDKLLEAGVARLMLDPEPTELDEDTMAAIDEGEAQYDRGEVTPIDEAFAQVRRKYSRK